MNNGWGLATAVAIGLLPTLVMVVWLRALVGGAGPKHPRWNVVGLTGAAMSLGAVAMGSAAAISVTWLAHDQPLRSLMHRHEHVITFPSFVGLAVSGWLFVVAVRVVLVWCKHWRFRRAVSRFADDARCRSLVMAEDDVPYAFTLPGPRQVIVVSSGLQQLLQPEERRVVLAHEMTHATFRHDRIRLASATLVAISRLFGPIARRIDLGLERWADERAAETTGQSRSFVAGTIAKVAIAALQFSGADVVARSVALASDPPGPVTGRQRLVAMTGGFGMLAAIVAQGHHLVALYEQFCR